MMNQTKIEELAQKVYEALPSGAKDLKEDIEKSVHLALQQGLSKLNLVSREEFDVQTQVLARTRAKLEMLEEQLAALEAQLQNRDH